MLLFISNGGETAVLCRDFRKPSGNMKDARQHLLQRQHSHN
jgi:hypothetical protein